MNIKRIIREELESDWGWTNELDETAFLVGKAFEFKHYDNLETYQKLFDFFISMGLKPIFGTPRDPEEVVGVYVDYMGDVLGWANSENHRHESKIGFVYTGSIYDDETYKEHIEEYAGKPLEFVDAEEFVKEYNL